ncbi:uncharacterized protein LOC105204532 [Solenopsis invicta]|uniref:uncharacterized protein LOC105204532 n=1 Tax=Solenopsis invicta TaxID=13686 RepID=UPI0005963B03|nr:uncharacterized protein LOC105204532 [Solenopsis invicta]
MKAYVCTISLLLCGLAYFVLQVQGYSPATCYYEGKYYTEGVYTLPDCYSQLICFDGRLTIKDCPITPCPHGTTVYSMQRGPGSFFPECCRKYECWMPKPF